MTKVRGPHAWRAAQLVALSALCLIDSLAAQLHFAGSWVVLGVLALLTWCGALLVIGPEQAPRFGSAAAASVALPLVLLVLGVAAVAEGGLLKFSAAAVLVVFVPFSLLWRFLGPRLLVTEEAAQRLSRGRAGGWVVALGAGWLLVRASRPSVVIAAPMVVLLVGIGVLLQSLRRAESAWCRVALWLMAVAVALLGLGAWQWRGTYRNRSRGYHRRPVEVPRLPERVPQALTAHNGAVCALYDDRSAYCFGENLGRFLGDDDRPFGGRRLSADHEMAALALARTAACSLDPGGVIRCWSGKPGGARHEPGEPIVVPQLPPAKRLFLGDNTGYAIASADSALWRWTLQEEISPALRINTIKDVSTIAAAEGLTCALHGDGQVSCWMQVGSWADDSPIDPAMAAPTAIELVRPARSIAVGNGVAYAALEDGSVLWWGDPWAHGLDNKRMTRPQPLLVGEPVVRVVAGAGFGCALSKAGRVWCWGKSGIYDGSDFSYDPPSRIHPAEEVADIVASGSGVCIALKAGRVACWGRL